MHTQNLVFDGLVMSDGLRVSLALMLFSIEILDGLVIQ